MDPITLTFYAIVCAVLSLLSPAQKSPVLRLLTGAGVGLLAAALLPILRAQFNL